MMNCKNRKQKRSGYIKIMIQKVSLICLLLVIAASLLSPMKAAAEEASTNQGTSQDGNGLEKSDKVLHAFYPSNAVFSEQMKKYIDGVDSISFAWSRIDSEDPGTLNTVRGKNGNSSFYYPADYIQPVEYAKSKGKTIQLNIYMDSNDCVEVLPKEEIRAAMIQAIIGSLQTDISQGEGIYYDGVVIDFEGLRDTDTGNMPLLYDGKPISTYFTQFLTELKNQLEQLQKKLYVAVNPGLYYDGYDYADILDVADHVILMAHDYEPTERLQKKQVQQYTGYNALEPIKSMAPIQRVRQALNEMTENASDISELSKVWLQITFDSAQWQFDVQSAAGWESLEDTTLSREGRSTPLYKSIKDRVDNKDGNGQSITYGYNNELQTPYLQYYNTADKSWNVILYEDSNSIRAKIKLAKSYGLGGISIWSLANVPDYTDTKGLKYHLDGWTALTDEMNTYGQPIANGAAVTFTDTAIEQAVREKLGKETGKITVSDLQSIYRLKLNTGVKNLADLKYFTNLEYLDAQKLGIKDITNLQKLKSLRVLYLQRNNISDISTLKKLTNLEILSLNGNQVVSVSALSSLTKLQELYLRENKINNISSLTKLSRLMVLELGMNSISNINAIGNLKKLCQLSLDNNKVKDIQALKSLTSLEALYLQRNSISSINPLSGLKSLKLLSLNGNYITDLKPLAKLTSLEMLYLKDNKITSITSLKGLINLNELYLGGNKVSDYSPVKKITLKPDFKCDFKIQ